MAPRALGKCHDPISDCECKSTLASTAIFKNLHHCSTQHDRTAEVCHDRSIPRRVNNWHFSLDHKRHTSDAYHTLFIFKNHTLCSTMLQFICIDNRPCCKPHISHACISTPSVITCENLEPCMRAHLSNIRIFSYTFPSGATFQKTKFPQEHPTYNIAPKQCKYNWALYSCMWAPKTWLFYGLEWKARV